MRRETIKVPKLKPRRPPVPPNKRETPAKPDRRRAPKHPNKEPQ